MGEGDGIAAVRVYRTVLVYYSSVSELQLALVKLRSHVASARSRSGKAGSLLTVYVSFVVCRSSALATFSLSVQEESYKNNTPIPLAASIA